MPATVRYGQHDRISILSLSGVVRYPVAAALRRVIETDVLGPNTLRVMVDLTGLEVLDSTGMGLLAHIGRATLERSGDRAVLAAVPPNVAPCLKSARFEVLFEIVDELPMMPPALYELVLEPTVTADAMYVMREAHAALVELGPPNRDTFEEVLRTLDAELKLRRS